MWQISVGRPPAPSAPIEVDTWLDWFLAASGAVSSLSGALAWPVVVGFVIYLFREEIRERIPKTKKLGVGPASLEFSESLADSAEKVAEVPFDVGQEPILPATDQEPALSTVAEPSTTSSAVDKEDIAPDKLRKYRRGTDPSFPGWAFWPTVKGEKYGIYAEQEISTTALISVDPAAAIVAIYGRTWAAMSDWAGLPGRSMRSFFQSRWAKNNIPPSLTAAFWSLRKTAVASQGSDVTQAEASSYRLIMDDFLHSLAPHLVEYKQWREARAQNEATDDNLAELS